VLQGALVFLLVKKSITETRRTANKFGPNVTSTLLTRLIFPNEVRALEIRESFFCRSAFRRVSAIKIFGSYLKHCLFLSFWPRIGKIATIKEFQLPNYQITQLPIFLN
jgi:hypothetical protein